MILGMFGGFRQHNACEVYLQGPIDIVRSSLNENTGVPGHTGLFKVCDRRAPIALGARFRRL